MSDDQDHDNVIEEDYYTFLNLPRNATPEEISNAYRRQSRMYHPDKHVDPALKTKAEVLFNRTSKAYEVLSNPHQRAIYDSLGTRGLQTKGWEIVQRTKTPQEIREEYERIAREREESRLERRTNPTGNVTVNINASDLFTPYDDDYDDRYSEGMFSFLEISGMSFSQSIEAPLTLRDTLMMYGQIDTQNGTGYGTVNFAARRTLSSKGWMEVDVGVGDGPKISLTGHRVLTEKIFCNAALSLKFDAHEARPGLLGRVGMQLDKHTAGYLTYKAGDQTSMSTTVVRDTPRSRSSVSISFGYVHSQITFGYTYRMEEKQLKLRGSVKLGTAGAYVTYGAEKKVSKHSALSADVRVGVPTGVTLKLKLIRASQTYIFPILLCDEILPAPVFYATVTPLVTWTIVKKFIVDPIVKERQEREKEKQKELNRTRMLEKQREAKNAVELMMVTFSRIRAEEEAKRGLIITKALYGRFVYPNGRTNSVEAAEPQNDEVIDVTVPLQCLVIDSKLVLHESSKSELPGFYDPCFGEDKQLLLQYLFHTQTHECIVKDNETLRIPRQSHRVNVT
ncbi:dnaJ homolog subfamily C member 11 [Venturia canescens]|uniref:dnaJ homolog subfamily C member 11 n=1 Tax=Venturia canescens TaxID=32260 RepID=UPI001C9C8064|nr:dnaJ homolog subfamily C member 11 [Venturia canescens]